MLLHAILFITLLLPSHAWLAETDQYLQLIINDPHSPALSARVDPYYWQLISDERELRVSINKYSELTENLKDGNLNGTKVETLRCFLTQKIQSLT